MFRRNYTAVSDIQRAVNAQINITRAGLEARTDRKAKLQLLIQLPQSLKPEVHVKLDLSNLFPPRVRVVVNKRKHVCQTSKNGTGAVIPDYDSQTASAPASLRGPYHKIPRSKI